MDSSPPSTVRPACRSPIGFSVVRRSRQSARRLRSRLQVAPSSPQQRGHNSPSVARPSLADDERRTFVPSMKRFEPRAGMVMCALRVTALCSCHRGDRCQQGRRRRAGSEGPRAELEGRRRARDAEGTRRPRPAIGWRRGRLSHLGGGVAAFRARLWPLRGVPPGGLVYWTVVDSGCALVGAADGFLRDLRLGVDREPGARLCSVHDLVGWSGRTAASLGAGARCPEAWCPATPAVVVRLAGRGRLYQANVRLAPPPAFAVRASW